jgi:hypothetical protein
MLLPLEGCDPAPHEPLAHGALLPKALYQQDEMASTDVTEAEGRVGALDARSRQMNGFQYSAVVTLVLWTAFAPAGAAAQEMAHPSRTPRPLLLALPEVPHPIQPRADWLTPARFPAGGEAAGVLRAQDPRNPRSERSLGRKVFGAAVGAAGGFFGGGYLGATIEGDRCHCDDPGLKGAVIGAPIGAVVGGILGWHYLF